MSETIIPLLEEPNRKPASSKKIRLQFQQQQDITTKDSVEEWNLGSKDNSLITGTKLGTYSSIFSCSMLGHPKITGEQIQNTNFTFKEITNKIAK